MPREPITDLSVYKDKVATPMQERFADWIVEQVGVTFATKAAEAAFYDGVRLAKALIMRYQASDASKEASAELKAEREERRAAAEAAAVAAAEATEAPAEEAKPAKATKAAKAAAPAAAAAAPAKAAPATRGRRGAAATPKVDAPF